MGRTPRQDGLLGFCSFFVALVIGRAAADVAKHQAQGITCSGSSGIGQRVVSVGDWHGDWKHAVESLTALGLLDNGHWSGGSTVLVQTGDVVDRGDDGRRLLELLFRLQDEALASGGQVIMLLGNHELMCMQGDLRYASPADLAAYGGVQGHRAAWAPQGQVGRELRRRAQILARVSDVLYSHAGLLPAMLDEFAGRESGAGAIKRLNAQAEALLQDDAAGLARSSSSLLGGDGPFWTRVLSLEGERRACPLLDRVLGKLGARRMVVGHTPQQRGDVGVRCGGRLLLADTFMSQAYTQSAAASAHNAAAVEFYNESSNAFAVYPLRSGSACMSLASAMLGPLAAADGTLAELRGTLQNKVSYTAASGQVQVSGSATPVEAGLSPSLPYECLAASVLSVIFCFCVGGHLMRLLGLRPKDSD